MTSRRRPPALGPAALEELSLDELRTRRLDDRAFPRVYLDTTYAKRRTRSGVVYDTVVVAVGVPGDGTADILGLGLGDSEDAEFWIWFFHSLRRRGLRGVTEVICDQEHDGAEIALATVFPAACLVVDPVLDDCSCPSCITPAATDAGDRRDRSSECEDARLSPKRAAGSGDRRPPTGSRCRRTKRVG